MWLKYGLKAQKLLAQGQELLPFQGVWGKTCESSVTYRTFAYQEVKGVKEVKELTRMSCSLKNYAKKTVVLTPQRTQGAITHLISLTSPHTKVQSNMRNFKFFALIFV